MDSDYRVGNVKKKLHPVEEAFDQTTGCSESIISFYPVSFSEVKRMDCALLKGLAFHNSGSGECSDEEPTHEASAFLSSFGDHLVV